MIAPADVEGTAQAIHAALTMLPLERRRRADNLRKAVEADDVEKWFREQLWDLGRFAILNQREPGAVLPGAKAQDEGERLAPNASIAFRDKSRSMKPLLPKH